MRYIIGDIHGCLDEYLELLEKINLTDDDTLYILGDACDRGPEPIKVLQDLLARPNVVYLLGNHDYMMLLVLRKLMAAAEKSKTDWDQYFSDEDMFCYVDWMNNGGDVTLRQFLKLSEEEQEDVIDFLEDALIYDVIEDKGRKYVLVHAGIDRFNINKALEDYDFTDFIFARPDYGERYFSDNETYVVTGHTPTQLIRYDRKPLIYQENGHIAIDCGCVFGGSLAAYCVETGEVIYVGAKGNFWGR